MPSKFKAAISRGNPEKGMCRVVLSVKTASGKRWEYVGDIPVRMTDAMMLLAASAGERESSRDGHDEGIALAFSKVARQ